MGCEGSLLVGMEPLHVFRYELDTVVVHVFRYKLDTVVEQAFQLDEDNKSNESFLANAYFDR